MGRSRSSRQEELVLAVEAVKDQLSVAKHIESDEHIYAGRRRPVHNERDRVRRQMQLPANIHCDCVCLSRTVAVRGVQLRIPHRVDPKALHETRADACHLRGGINESCDSLRQRETSVIEPIPLEVVRMQPDFYAYKRPLLPDDPGDTRETRLVRVDRRKPPTER